MEVIYIAILREREKIKRIAKYSLGVYSHKSKFISCNSYSILEIIFYTHFIETKGDV